MSKLVSSHPHIATRQEPPCTSLLEMRCPRQFKRKPHHNLRGSHTATRKESCISFNSRGIPTCPLGSSGTLSSVMQLEEHVFSPQLERSSESPASTQEEPSTATREEIRVVHCNQQEHRISAPTCYGPQFHWCNLRGTLSLPPQLKGIPSPLLQL